MAFNQVKIVPSGVNIERTLSDNQTGISFSNFIRWKGDIPEKRGGCTLFANIKFAGRPLDLHAFQDVANNKFLGIGTTTNLYAYNSTSLAALDITPQIIISDNPPNFSVTVGSNQITIIDPGITNPTTYDAVLFNTPVSVGGLVLQYCYAINQVDGTHSYEITDDQYATSTTLNGGVLPYFTVIGGNALVSVTFPGHQYQNGDLVAFTVPTVVGGLTIHGQYIVTNNVPGVSYKFAAQYQAAFNESKYMNNGNVNLTYYITIGPPIEGSGYGVGYYGQGGYGTGINIPATTGTPVVSQDWYLDNWGEYLIASQEGGPLFTWSDTTGNANASIIINGPSQNSGAFVAMPQQQLMAWGSTYTGLSDPLQIRWSDVGNYNIWTPTVTNQAGGYRIPTGSRIIRGIQGPTQQYWFTDVDVYVAQYIGAPFVYGFNKVGSGCGLIASKAIGILGGNLYWMSQRQFFMLGAGGAVTPLPCTVWDFIFQNLNYNYIDNVKCGPNSMFNEINWFFPSNSSLDGTNDCYICYNTQFNEWDCGFLPRAAWIDQSLLGGPISADYQGYIYQHETSNDLAGLPINAYFQTGYFSLTNGNDFVFVDWLIPDMKWGQYDQAKNAVVNISFNVVDYPGDTPITYGPFPVTQQTQYIEPRFRGRYMQLIVQSQDLGSFWRLGSIRYRFAMSGRR